MDAPDARAEWLADVADIFVCPGSVSIHLMNLNSHGRAQHARETHHDLAATKIILTSWASVGGLTRLRGPSRAENKITPDKPHDQLPVTPQLIPREASSTRARTDPRAPEQHPVPTPLNKQQKVGLQLRGRPTLPGERTKDRWEHNDEDADRTKTHGKFNQEFLNVPLGKLLKTGHALMSTTVFACCAPATMHNYVANCESST